MEIRIIIGFVVAVAIGFAGLEVSARDGNGKKSDSTVTVWVKRSDGGLSCSPDKAESLDDGALKLMKARIKILESKKTNDGKMHIQVCGAPSGTENAYKIKRSDLKKALVLGFREGNS